MRALMAGVAVAATMVLSCADGRAQGASADPTVLRLIESMQAQQVAMMQLLARLMPPTQPVPPSGAAPRTEASDNEVASLWRRVHQLEQALATRDAAGEPARSAQKSPVALARIEPAALTIPAAIVPPAQSGRVQTAAAPAGEPAAPSRRPSQWSVSADVLYWKPHTTDNVLGYVGASQSSFTSTSTTNSFTSTSTSNNTGSAARVEYDRSPGIRAGIAYRPGGTNVDVNIGGTLLRASGREEKTNVSQCLGCTLFRAGEGDLHFVYDVADLGVGYTLTPTPGLSLRPFGGARYAHIAQNLETTYQGGSGGTTVDAQQSSQSRSQLDAVGGRLGMDAAFLLGEGFSLTSRAGGSLLYGLHENSFQLFNSSTSVFSSPTFTSTSSSRSYQSASSRGRIVVPALDIDLGVSWLWQAGDTASVEFAAGYHFEHWFNLAASNSPAPTSLSDLSLDGPYMRITGRW